MAALEQLPARGLGDVEMKMRSVRVARITDATDHLTASNGLARFYGDAVALQMSVMNERVIVHRYDDVVSVCVRYRRRPRGRWFDERPIVGETITRCVDDAIDDSKDLSSESDPVLV